MGKKNASLESYRIESKLKDLGEFAKSLWQVSVSQDSRVLNTTLQIILLSIETDSGLPFDIDWDLKFCKLDCSLWTGCYLIWKALIMGYAAAFHHQGEAICINRTHSHDSDINKFWFLWFSEVLVSNNTTQIPSTRVH